MAASGVAAGVVQSVAASGFAAGIVQSIAASGTAAGSSGTGGSGSTESTGGATGSVSWGAVLSIGVAPRDFSHSGPKENPASSEDSDEGVLT